MQLQGEPEALARNSLASASGSEEKSYALCFDSFHGRGHHEGPERSLPGGTSAGTGGLGHAVLFASSCGRGGPTGPAPSGALTAALLARLSRRIGGQQRS